MSEASQVRKRTATDACMVVLSESRDLGLGISEASGLPVAPVEERRFEGGEFKLRPLQSVRDRDVFVVQTLAGTVDAPVSDRFLRLCFLLSVLRDCGARRCFAVVPYLAFARKDRRTQLRDPVNTRYVATLLEAAGADRLVALDVHNPAALDNAFRIPVDHLSALPMMAAHFAERLAQRPLAVASPDVGGIKRAQIFREQLESLTGRPVELLFVEKRRVLDQVTGGTLVGDAAGRAVVIIDDLCATGGTLIRAATACLQAGAAEVHTAVTHAPTPDGLHALLGSDAVATVVVTDSVGEPLRGVRPLAGERLFVLPATRLIGEALRRMVAAIPVGPLLERWPAPPEPAPG